MRYSIARRRLSYRDHGRHGWAWGIYDDELQGAIGHVDTEAQARAVATALNDGTLDRYDMAAMRRIVREGRQP